MAEEIKRVIKIAEPDPDPNTETLTLPAGFGGPECPWVDGASYHMVLTPRGFSLVRDERPV